MIGKLTAGLIKVVSLPVDAASATLDVLTGGDGSKRSRTKSAEFANPFALVEKIRDEVAKAAEEIDE